MTLWLALAAWPTIAAGQRLRSGLRGSSTATRTGLCPSSGVWPLRDGILWWSWVMQLWPFCSSWPPRDAAPAASAGLRWRSAALTSGPTRNPPEFCSGFRIIIADALCTAVSPALLRFVPAASRASKRLLPPGRAALFIWHFQLRILINSDAQILQIADAESSTFQGVSMSIPEIHYLACRVQYWNPARPLHSHRHFGSDISLFGVSWLPQRLFSERAAELCFSRPFHRHQL